jgi:Cupin-like domain
MTGTIDSQPPHQTKTTFVFYILENICHSLHYITTYACLIPGQHLYVVSAILAFLIPGIKTWTLIPPEYATFLYSPTGTLPKSIESLDNEFPSLSIACDAAITVTQYPGETIFVPSGWHHQVVNQGYHLLFSLI